MTKCTYICRYMTKKKQIALLFFSRSAALEGRKKAWFSAGSGSKNKTLAAALIRHTYQTLEQSGFPVFHFHENNQQGQTFGERLANAYQEVFDLGYEAVVAVGNDTPEIDRIDWHHTANQLMAGKCVIGPTFRKGAYLIGITAEAFKKEAFEQLPWQSEQLFQALHTFCTRSNEPPVLLDTLRDLNTRGDLGKLRFSSFLDLHLKRVLLSLLFFPVRILSGLVSVLTLKLFLLGHAHFRAPPSPSFSSPGR